MDLHDKSHYGALSSYAWRLFFWLMSVSQGIYPVVVVILVHSQKSYIEDSTTVTSTPFEFASAVFKSYENGKAEVEWQTKAGCEFQGDGNGGSGPDGGSKDENDNSGNGDVDTPERSVGSGIGWFFLL